MPSALVTTSTLPLIPANAPRPVRAEYLATALAFDITTAAGHRALVEIITDFLASFRITDDPRGVAYAIAHRALENQKADSEFARFARAADATFEELFGIEVNITGWLPGEQITINGEDYELTGNACSECRVHPEVYTASGPVCFDSAQCTVSSN